MQSLLLITPWLQQFADANSCSKSFMGLKTWFAYFPASWFGDGAGNACGINKNFQLLPASGQSGLLLIGLAIADDLLRIATLVAVGYVIYGGIQYETSNGDPNATKTAQQTIINSLIGLVLAILAASIVGFVGDQLGK